MIADAFICALYLVAGAALFAIATGLVLFTAWLLGVDLDRVELP